MSQRNQRSDETLLFLHIPKAAGTTLARIAERQFPGYRQYRLGENAQAAIERFNGWPQKTRSRYRYIAGHFPFGVHEQVPGPCAYLTFLREPLARTASFYRFVRNQPDHPLTRRMSASQKDSLLGFLKECDDPIFDNGMTRQLAGDWGQRPFGSCDEELFEQARSNLAQVDVVGLTEQFIPSLLLTAERFGWKRIGFHSLNQTLNASEEESDPTVQDYLRRLNQYDLRLYALAETRFQQDCEALGDPFRERVKTFPRIHPPPSPLRESLDRIQSRSLREIVKHVLGVRKKVLNNTGG